MIQIAFSDTALTCSRLFRIASKETVMKKTLLLATLCTLGTVGAAFVSPAPAADRDRHYDRHERIERHDDRHHSRHESRHDRRVERRDDRFHGRYYRPRYVMNGRYCDDRRHLHAAHYHV